MAKKSIRKKLVARLDTIFSLVIRKRDQKLIGHCAFCNKPIQHCFHFITRAKHSTRWEMLNAIGSCAGCNLRMEYDPHPFITWFIRKHGLSIYEELVLRSNKIAKFENSELEDMILAYTKMLNNA